MKTIRSSYPVLLALLALALAVKLQADTKVPTGIGQIRSVFILPASPKEGRDPFFPLSSRTIGNPVVSTNHIVEITSIKVPGISGAPGHLLAIINTHTFAIGEEGDVKTDSGSLHIRCVDIQANHVMVLINGQIHRLNVESQ